MPISSTASRSAVCRRWSSVRSVLPPGTVHVPLLLDEFFCRRRISPSALQETNWLEIASEPDRPLHHKDPVVLFTDPKLRSSNECHQAHHSNKNACSVAAYCFHACAIGDLDAIYTSPHMLSLQLDHYWPMAPFPACSRRSHGTTLALDRTLPSPSVCS